MTNKVILLGNLGNTPEVKTLTNGQQLAKFSLATNEYRTNAKGERSTDTQWHSIIVWGKLAGVAQKYLQKGSEVLVEGKLQYTSYTDKEGVKRYSTEINVSEFKMVGAKAA